MRISTKGRHAGMAMVDFAKAWWGTSRSFGRCRATSNDLLVLPRTARCQIEKARFGQEHERSGWRIYSAHDLQNITVQQIVGAVDTATTRERPVFEGENLTARQITDQLWQDIAEEVQAYLRSVTLADRSVQKGRSRSQGS